jgi:hypothetical protein
MFWFKFLHIDPIYVDLDIDGVPGPEESARVPIWVLRLLSILLLRSCSEKKLFRATALILWCESFHSVFKRVELNVDEEKSPVKGGEVLEPDEGEGVGR